MPVCLIGLNLVDLPRRERAKSSIFGKLAGLTRRRADVVGYEGNKYAETKRGAERRMNRRFLNNFTAPGKGPAVGQFEQ